MSASGPSGPLVFKKLSEVPEYSKMQFHMMTLLDVLCVVAWVR